MKPKAVGYWAVQVTPRMELIKWGKDGDTEFPYTWASEAISQLHYVKSSEKEECMYYILRLFDNGQMKTFELE